MSNEVPNVVWKLVFGADEARNIFREVDRMCLVPRALCLCPQVLRQDSFRISWRLLVLTVSHVVLAFLLLCYYSATTLDADDSGENRNFLVQGLSVVKICGYLTSPVAAVYPLLETRRLNVCLSNISLVDMHLKRLGYTSGQLAGHRSGTARWVHWGLCFAVNPLMLLSSFDRNVPWLLALSWPNLMTTVILELIISLQKAPRLRMDAIVPAATHVGSFSNNNTTP